MTGLLSTFGREKMLTSGGFASGSFYAGLAIGGTELSGATNYVRKAFTFTAVTEGPATLGAISDSGNTIYAGYAIAAGTTYLTNTSSITYPVAGNTWGVIDSVVVYDALSGGNLIGSSTSAYSSTVTQGSQYVIPAGDLILTLT